MKTLKTTLTIALLALGMTVGGSAFAANDTCSNFRIRVVNASGPAPIKVIKIEYRDYDVNQKRNAVTGNRKINPNRAHIWTKNLRHVDNDMTRLYVTYREKRAYQAGYHSPVTVSGNRFRCRDNGIHTVRIN